MSDTSEKIGSIPLKYGKKIIGQLKIHRLGEKDGTYTAQLEWSSKEFWGYKISANSKVVRDKVEVWDMSYLELVQIAGPLVGVGTKPTLGFK